MKCFKSKNCMFIKNGSCVFIIHMHVKKCAKLQRNFFIFTVRVQLKKTVDAGILDIFGTSNLFIIKIAFRILRQNWTRRIFL